MVCYQKAKEQREAKFKRMGHSQSSYSQTNCEIESNPVPSSHYAIQRTSQPLTKRSHSSLFCINPSIDFDQSVYW